MSRQGRVAAGRDNGSRGRPKGYAEWCPREHTRLLILKVNAILEEFEALLPLTIRQVFYRLVGAYDYPKDENAYERLCNALNRARRAGMVPFDRLRDDGITVMQGAYYDGIEGFHAHVRSFAEAYEIDKLVRQRTDVRVLCEAAGMLPQLYRTCHPYSVPVYSCSGFDSLTAKYDLARHCARKWFYEGQPTVILHLGDHDPSGVSIYESMREDVLEFVAADVPHQDPEEVALFERAALRPGHIVRYQLTVFPPKESDTRSGRWVGQTCQLEALPPDLLAEELERAILQHMDEQVLAEDRDKEAHERRQLIRDLSGGTTR